MGEGIGSEKDVEDRNSEWMVFLCELSSSFSSIFEREEWMFRPDNKFKGISELLMIIVMIVETIESMFDLIGTGIFALEYTQSSVSIGESANVGHSNVLSQLYHVKQVKFHDFNCIKTIKIIVIIFLCYTLYYVYIIVNYNCKKKYARRNLRGKNLNVNRENPLHNMWDLKLN